MILTLLKWRKKYYLKKIPAIKPVISNRDAREMLQNLHNFLNNFHRDFIVRGLLFFWNVMKFDVLDFPWAAIVYTAYIVVAGNGIRTT